MTQPDQVADSPDQPAAGAAPGAAHAGSLAVRVAQAHGVETMFTLSGAHVFPMYDGAVQADPPMRLLDVRHEQTAAFAAEATGKLTRVPGLAVLTAGPGVTNGISAIAQAQLRRVPAGGRRRPGAGQPLGHGQPAGARPPADRRAGRQVRPHPPHGRRRGVEAWTRPSRWPGRRTAVRSSSTCRWTSSSPARRPTCPPPSAARGADPDPEAVAEIAELLSRAERPVLVLGTDVWADGAEHDALALRRARRPADAHQRHGPWHRPRRPSRCS